MRGHSALMARPLRLPLVQLVSPKVFLALTDLYLISSSGMVTGGRILHHLAQRLPDPRNLVIFIGFQAPGTRDAQRRTHRLEANNSGRFSMDVEPLNFALTRKSADVLGGTERQRLNRHGWLPAPGCDQ